MRRLRIGVFLLLALHLGGCDGESKQKDAISKPSALTGSAPAGTTAEEKPSTNEHTLPGSTVQTAMMATWENVGRDGQSIQSSELILHLKNISKYVIDATAVLICHGLIKYEAEVEVGRATIGPGEEQSFVFPQNKFPIQTNNGAAQASLDVRMRYWNELTGKQTSLLATAEFYYRHNESYTEVETFDDMYLMKNGGGHITGFKERTTGKRSLGRVMEPGGGFRTIVEDDLAVMENGKVVGYTIGMDMEVNQEADTIADKEVQ